CRGATSCGSRSSMPATGGRWPTTPSGERTTAARPGRRWPRGFQPATGWAAPRSSTPTRAGRWAAPAKPATRPASCGRPTRAPAGRWCPGPGCMTRARPLALIGTALVVLAVAAFAYLRPPAPVAITNHPPAPFAVEAWRFTATGSGWVAVRGLGSGGGRSALYATRDGGRSWSRLTLLGVPPYVTWLDHFDSQHGIVQLIRDESDARASLLATDDGGTNRRELQPPSRTDRGTPWFLDRRHGWLLAPDSLTRTT